MGVSAGPDMQPASPAPGTEMLRAAAMSAVKNRPRSTRSIVNPRASPVKRQYVPQQTRNQRLPSGMVRLLVVGFDEDAPQMGITGCDNRAACLFGAAGILSPDDPDKRLGALRRRDRC